MPLTFTTARNAPRDIDVLGVPVFTERAGAPLGRHRAARRSPRSASRARSARRSVLPQASGPDVVVVGLGDPGSGHDGHAAHGGRRVRPSRGQADVGGHRR